MNPVVTRSPVTLHFCHRYQPHIYPNTEPFNAISLYSPLRHSEIRHKSNMSVALRRVTISFTAVGYTHVILFRIVSKEYSYCRRAG